MRPIVLRPIALFAIFVAMSSAPAHASGAGAYASPTAASASDCIKLCRDDSLCVGWTYEAGACGLWASAPRDPPSPFTLSSHAPAFAQRMEAGEAGPAARSGAAVASHGTAAAALLGGDGAGDDIRPRLGGD